MSETVIITGNHAVSYGAWSSRVRFVAAYPITPQTTIVEMLSDFVNTGKMKAEFMTVESEHSAAAAVMGAESTGVRSFTATSSHGLLYMSEVVHWIARSRLPVVMVVVNRAIAPPWSIWTELLDTMTHRDAGWIQVYVSNNQEAYDMVIQSYRLSEMKRVSMPTMICMDGFILSHTFAPVTVHTPEETDEFLPSYSPLWKIDPENPFSLGNMATPDYYYEFSYLMHEAHENAKKLFNNVDKEFERFSGRSHGGKVHGYMLDDSESVILAMGTLSEEVMVAIDNLRKRGEKVGALKVRLFRPFPAEEISKALEDKEFALILDRSLSYGYEGQLATETKAALHTSGIETPVINMITGLGGRDVTYKEIEKFHGLAKKKVSSEKGPFKPIFIQLKR